MPNPVSIDQLFSNWCRQPEYSDEEFWKPFIDHYSFTLRIVVSKDIPPRHSTFSWIRGMGVSKYDDIFQKDVRLPHSWLLAFPERHISVQEQAALIKTLVDINIENNYPMKHLDILTSCAWIISDTKSELVNIIGFPEGKVSYDQDYMSF